MVEFEKNEEKVCVKRNDEEWRAIQCPVLFINGENDSFGSCTELKEKVPHAEGFEVKGCGHRPHFAMEHAKEVNERIVKFLDFI